jgi:hypothetical protein
MQQLHHIFGIQPDELVPLPDMPGVTVLYRYLRELEKLKGLNYRFLPQDASREYSVGELVEGIMDEDRGSTVEPPPPLRPNIWVNGSFFLILFIVVIVALLAVSNFVSWLAIPGVIIGAILTFIVVGVLILRSNNQLKDASLRELIDMTLRSLPLIKTLGKRPAKAAEKQRRESRRGRRRSSGY